MGDGKFKFFSEHGKSGELGNMAGKLFTGFTAATLAEESGQDPYTQSGGFTEGGEEGGGGPTVKDRFREFAAGVGSKNYIDYLGKSADVDKTSAHTRYLNETAAKLKVEREQEMQPFDIAEATGQLDSTGVLTTEITNLANMGGFNANGGAFTKKEWAKAIQTEGFAADIGTIIRKVNAPLAELIKSQDRQLTEGLDRYKNTTTGKVDIEQIMSNPDVLGENPKLAKMYESMQANKERYKKANKGLAYFDTLAARAAPITTKQMEADANLNGIAQIINANPGITKADATTMWFAEKGFPALQAQLSTWGGLPSKQEVLDGKVGDDVWQLIGAQIFTKTGQMVEGESIKKAYLGGLEASGYERGYGGYGNSQTSFGQDGGISTTDYNAEMNAVA